jgi:hypothetical protein
LGAILRGATPTPEQVARDKGLSRRDLRLILAKVDKVLRASPPGAKRAPAPRRPNVDAVFINVPFDRSYERLLIALVAGLVALKLAPRSVLDVPADGGDRLSRLKRLIRQCPYSLHDLSYP